jgi:rfaE bifunctional protein nucleotidyltransferase chain/domain
MTGHKIRSLPAAAAWRRSAPAPVVFTNGVFDLLHPGHIKALEDARALGATLVVGINDDASARRLGKGPGRPVNTAEARARVIAALAAVDCVVLFAEDTPEVTIQRLEPDVLVKGDDYSLDGLVGRDVVLGRGGRIHVVPRDARYSTTRLIERIRAVAT